MREGLSALEEQVCARLSAAEQENLRPRQLEFLCSAAAALRAFRVTARALSCRHQKRHAPICTPCSGRFPSRRRAPSREAVQSLWFCFAFTRLCGNW